MLSLQVTWCHCYHHLSFVIIIIIIIIINTNITNILHNSVGTVPVYLGDSHHLKSLLPHPKAAIFIYDYHNDYNQLAQYLKYLINNQTAYEEHR